MSTTTTGLRQLSLVCLATPDQDAAIAFYESIGFEKRTDTPFSNGYRWVEVYLPEGNAGIALAPPREGTDVQPVDSGIVLTTDDIDATHAEMRRLGVDVDVDIMRMGGPVPAMFWFRDPTGHTLLVVEEG